MIGIDVLSLILGFIATLLVGTFGLSKFILKHDENDINRIKEKYNKDVISKNFNALRGKPEPTQNDLNMFFSEYRKVVELDSEKEDTEKSGKMTYISFILTTLLFLLSKVFPNFRFLNYDLTAYGYVAGFFCTNLLC